MLTSALFTGTTISPFSTPYICIAIWPISIKFAYVMLTLHTKCEKTSPVVQEIHVLENFPIFFTLYSSSQRYTNVTLSQAKVPFLWIDFFKFGTPIRYFVPYLSLKFGDL